MTPEFEMWWVRTHTHYGPGAFKTAHEAWDAGFAAGAASRDAQVAGLAEVLKKAHEHVVELREAFQEGRIRETDNLGGTRSSRNVDVEVSLRAALAAARTPDAGPV